jgi:hypothetical protein
VLDSFTPQSAGGCAGAAGGVVAVQGPIFSDFWSPMILTHEPENDPLPVKLRACPLAVAETWNDVLPPLTVALRTK